jgi:hypothetical protein
MLKFLAECGRSDVLLKETNSSDNFTMDMFWQSYHFAQKINRLNLAGNKIHNRHGAELLLTCTALELVGSTIQI